MSGRFHSSRTGHDLRLWPVLLLLLAVVVAPTACLLWFMSRAIENERLAVRQTLEQAYRRDLVGVQTQLQNYWQQQSVALEEMASADPPASGFARVVRSELADAVILYDDRGEVTYPNVPSRQPGLDRDLPAEWDQAVRLEYAEHDPLSAAVAYEQIAQSVEDPEVAARALQAQARCLVQSGQTDAAIDLIATSLNQPQYQTAVDPQGRLIVPNAQLMALQRIADPEQAVFRQIAGDLKQRLGDYSDAELTAAQRRFLLHELSILLPGQTTSTMLRAEDMAASFVAAHPSPRRDVGLHASQLPDVWQLASADRRAVALFRTQTVITHGSRLLAEADLPPEVVVRLLPPNEAPVPADLLFSLPAGKSQPGWQLTLSLTNGDSADLTAKGRIAVYLWTGLLVIVGMGILAGWIAQVFRRQVHVARLKNDLVATVSHELKTPLASIRLLVDTLLDLDTPDPVREREYLQMISKENSRLSRLIDNFLTFSRMERNKHAFEFAPTSPQSVVESAVQAMGERLESPACDFRLDLSRDLPMIHADPDALTTALINLLDNAWKYTPEQKQIALKVTENGRFVDFAVSDNGIGISRAALKKVFQRFYQVDRRLSRTTGGCGLGLSIVKYIAEGHGGMIQVHSRPGTGSTFVLRVPTDAGVRQDA